MADILPKTLEIQGEKNRDEGKEAKERDRKQLES